MKSVRVFAPASVANLAVGYDILGLAIDSPFIKAFAKLNQYQGNVTFGAWLKRIVINKSIDCLKAKKQHLQEGQLPKLYRFKKLKKRI